MATAKLDFERFVSWLYAAGRPDEPKVRKLAHLCLRNFEALAATTRNRSQRSVYLVALARNSLNQIEDVAPAEAQAAAVDAWPWKRLREFTLGPFRGFRTPEAFDLTKQVVLFYGPNGSGKTSLCEGLEYALLGEVEEADSKRITPRTYLANLHARRFVEPRLSATDHQGNSFNVSANLDAYRFCFVEKNRIDAFSRIAARPTAQRAELIATLFGMDQFNEFVGHFNENIDGQLILVGSKQASLDAKRTALANDQQTVAAEAQALAGQSGEEAALAVEYAAGVTYIGLKQLIGSADAPGRLQELDAILERVPLAAVGITRQKLVDALDMVSRHQAVVDETEAALHARSNQVSFKGLYDAVLALQAATGDRCPACDTPLTGTTHVRTNPYERATAGIAELRELGVLQERQRTAQRDVEQAARELQQLLNSVDNFLTAQQEQHTDVAQFISGLPPIPAGKWWGPLVTQQVASDTQSSLLDELFGVANRIEAQDAVTKQAHQDREPFANERRRLSDFQLKVQAMDLRRRQLVESIAAARGRISAFDEANAQLIAEAAQEQIAIDCGTPLKSTYDRFLAQLKAYRDQLPGQLMAGLNETALNLYNAFNRNDLDADKLTALHLPVAAEEKIEIAFRGAPDRRVDALHVLSEGHIRCLGLAILLAKASNMGCPTIVFDDAINAIDHDHRGGIREALFESETFAETQFIVTCHSNEFIKDIQQHLPAARRNECIVYLLRHHIGDHHPRVSRNIQNANYIGKARAAREALNDRDALGASRQALEMLSEKIWGWLGSHDLGVLTLPLAGFGAEPALRNLCEALTKKLRDAKTFNHPNRDPLITAFERILGIPANNLVWTYLNKGTHEEADRDDFDGELVESVVKTLEEIDRLDLRRNR
ncbi:MULTISPECIES: AAA family ATPase [Paraburkholderia]|uniref:AAA family ATPase n=1 Tax=Paraburkholderia TaxID=1822464 RepID=UPI002252B39A|nr:MULTISPECIES: AAA family ATPase [Paraburkholderia]MCX4156312.1 AAA family ATPase [Paraburkholderia aspalathi]MDN7165717.1 AAA family ATPase [Paraburkholderia sp. SECH2]MDQ6394203.1 AAA family ATPase [Paraburkholderia aspalathi]